MDIVKQEEIAHKEKGSRMREKGKEGKEKKIGQDRYATILS